MTRGLPIAKIGMHHEAMYKRCLLRYRYHIDQAVQKYEDFLSRPVHSHTEMLQRHVHHAG